MPEVWDVVALVGPDDPMWAHGGLPHVSTDAGLEVWDPARGARVTLVNGFRPDADGPDAAAVTGVGARISA